MDVTNIIAKAMSSPLDLEDLYLTMSAQGYNASMPRKFPALFVKLKPGTCTLFSTGRITFNGVKTPEDLNKLASVLSKILSENGKALSEPEIVNIAASFHTNSRVDLASLSLRCKGSIFEPDLSNSIEVPVQGCKALVHHTGNGIITGAKSHADLTRAYEALLGILKHY